MVRIITDTTAVLSPRTIARYQIPVIPQIVSFGEQSFYEGLEIDNAAFLARLKTAPELPKTAAPPPELFVQEFQRLVPLGEPILCIHPSAEVSGTVRSATVARQDFPGADIRVIDTRLIASALGSLVEIAAQMAMDGAGADAIEAALLELAPRGRIYFLVATLEYLAKGGRIGGAAHLLGSVLQIKPIFTFREGRVDQYEKERTHKRAVQRLKEIVLEQYPRHSPGYLAVMHAGVPEQGQALARELGDQLGLAHVPIVDVPPAVIAHGGPGVLGVSFFARPA